MDEWGADAGAALVHELVDDDEIEGVLEQIGAASSPTSLRLEANTLEDERFAMFLESADLSSLETLDLSNCYGLGDLTAASLAIGEFPNLRRVCLNWSGVTDKGLFVLAKHRGNQLEYLQGIHLKDASKQGLLLLHSSPLENAYVSVPDQA